MTYIIIAALVLLSLGIAENRFHQLRRKQIPIVIHVNGTRGKSTTTRLIAGGLRQNGLRVIAKTTGTTPRLILENGEEIDIKRKGPANISEYFKVVSLAAQKKADVLISECMALNPELQWVSENKILNADIGVITNVREDHLEVMGPTLTDAAKAMGLTIPRKGNFITADNKFTFIFQDICSRKNTKIHYVTGGSIDDDVILDFPYIVFKENIAIGLKVCELLGVDREVALKGMLSASPDPGVSGIIRLSAKNKDIYLINAFAANDCESTLLTWDAAICGKIIPADTILGIFNSRFDRSWRILQFMDLLRSSLPIEKLLLIGEWNYALKRAVKRNFSGEIIDLSRKHEIESILDYLEATFSGNLLVFGFGNTRGLGEDLIKHFKENGVPAEC